MRGFSTMLRANDDTAVSGGDCKEDTGGNSAMRAEHSAASAPLAADEPRPRVVGKFLYAGNEKLWVKGVTYGTFHPRADGCEFPEEQTVADDFAQMAACGINAVRTYTTPPGWLLDRAQAVGLRVMAGLAWEQHVAFCDDPALIARIDRRIRDGVRICAGHPALLCFAIGNEIPLPIVRWHGRRSIERFLKRLYRIAKAEDPAALVTYVNYPTTEFLQLPFLDFQCFNVYLEERDALADYLARLQSLVGDQPLVLAEIGLDSQRNGVDHQAASLRWQLRVAFEEGCAGSFVFAWTDEWFRGGHDIDDWDFGLTTRRREPKPALRAVRNAYEAVPFGDREDAPRVSVVVCSYNGALTIRDTFEGLARLAYPNYEVIVINDGSKDATADIAEEYDVRLISTENRGLSSARNMGWQASTGEIVAYIDDDAYPDPHWLDYLVHCFNKYDVVGVGGPNLAPPGDGPIADCVYNAPGGPVHVLLTARVAEHIPGCNMAFRRSALEAVGGFDPCFRTAGDDVDLCWRMQERGWQIGFHAAAMDWHRRRNSLRAYWKQQQGYGKAEALLVEKWPLKYNALGHHGWRGQLYGRGVSRALRFSRSRIYGGPAGSALFQSLYGPPDSLLRALPLMPEWYLIILLLAALTVLGLSWPPLLWCAPLLAGGIAAPVAQAVMSAARAEFPTPRPNRLQRVGLGVLIALLHLAQPAARLKGRMQQGLTPWRHRKWDDSAPMADSAPTLWVEHWQDPHSLLLRVVELMHSRAAPAVVGGDFDAWDLEMRGTLLGGTRMAMAVEEHGSGQQLFRFRLRAAPSALFATVAGAFLLGAVVAASDGAIIASFALLVLGMAVLRRMLKDIAAAKAAVNRALQALPEELSGATLNE